MYDGLLDESSVPTIDFGTDGALVTVISGGTTFELSGLDSLSGDYGNDVVTSVTDSTQEPLIGFDALVGVIGTDLFVLADGGATLLAPGGVDTLIGGGGHDLVSLGSGGATLLALAHVETLVGGGGGDVVTLGGDGGTMIQSGLETLFGGAGTDVVLIGDTGETLLVEGLETLVGGAGTDVVVIADGGSTTLARGVESLTGGAGEDLVRLGDTGGSCWLRGVESLVGGAGADIIELDGGATVRLSGVETLIGLGGTDVVTLDDATNEMTVSGIHLLTGGADGDTVTVSGDQAMRFEGGAGADTLTLAPTHRGSQVAFSSAGDGGAPGANTGYDRIVNFHDGGDTIVLAGELGNAFDHNGDGAAHGEIRATDTVDLAVDEVVALADPVQSLTDAGLASVRAAVGGLRNTSPDAPFAVIANDAHNAGLYAVVDANGDGRIAANEIALLGVFEGTGSLKLTDIIFG